MSSFNTAAQLAVPAWARARGLAVYLVVFQGGMALGSFAWGAVADYLSSSVALLAATITLILGLAAMAKWRLQSGEDLDLAPSAHWPEPLVLVEPQPDQGPVLVTVEYRIAPERLGEFAAAIAQVAPERRRDGAMRWGIFCDSADVGRCVETFLVESWVEHLRQHERVTVADRLVEECVRSFHIGDGPPVVSHLVFLRLESATELISAPQRAELKTYE